MNLEKTLEQNFLTYSAYVIQRRAIPDARDMLKYTGRQILHAQHREKLDYKHPFKKSQKSVSAATSFSYVHGGDSAYGQIIKMGRPLVQRYFLEEINGNGGTPAQNDDYSAERYTEARLSLLGWRMFETIDMQTIHMDDWERTYDEEGLFPKVLPSVGFYNICNGSFGSIAPTMISSIPQFNIKDINEAIINLINNPNAEVNIYPDFASGGILMNPGTVAQSLECGEGKSAILRGKITKHIKEGFLVVSELPYGVYTNTVCQEIEKAIEKGECPITTFKDLSKETVSLKIFAKDLDAAEEWLYKNTSVQKHFTIKMIMLDEGKTPKLFNLRSALLAHIKHTKQVWKNAIEFQLQGLKDREDIILGLLKAYSILDEIVATIKQSRGRADAIIQLKSLYQFSEAQATAIVDLRLHRLSAIDIEALKEELEKNRKQQEGLVGLLQDELKFNANLIAPYEDNIKRFADARRTQI